MQLLQTDVVHADFIQQLRDFFQNVDKMYIMDLYLV